MGDGDDGRLGRLAGLMFDGAARLWYRALWLEAAAAVVGLGVAMAAPTGLAGLVLAVSLLALVAAAYAVRLFAEDRHETAQTMRRQAALSEGLGWRIEPTQLAGWRRKAGVALLRRVDDEPRDPAYYATRQPRGPRRMAEMTLESCFYTYHVVIVIRQLLFVALLVAGLVVAVTGYLALSLGQSDELDAAVAQVAAAIVSLLITLDVVGWILRLGRQLEVLREVQAGLDRTLEAVEPDLRDVLRVVSEYDCGLVTSIPVHGRLWAWKHDDIAALWRERVKGTPLG